MVNTEVKEEETPSDSGWFSSSSKRLPNLKTVPWSRQFSCVFHKNVLLMSRRPMTVGFLLLSGVLSVLLTWWAAKDPEHGKYPPAWTECGTVPQDFYSLNDDWTFQDKIQETLNDRWQFGGPTGLLALGPMFNSVAVFNIVYSTDVSTQMLGVLRALGLRDSVFWLSWFVIFALLALVNSLLGGITAKLVSDVHAFEAIFFGGIFMSLWMLQLALIPASFVWVAVCGTCKRGPNWIILLFMVSVWIPTLMNAMVSWTGTTPTGIFWLNKHTYEGITAVGLETS
jgi:putative flippase GtrA